MGVEECFISVENPTTSSKASKEVWRKVIKEEITSIEKSNTWTPVKAPKAFKTLGVKWV